ncbi:sugar phosphate permease [Kineothrix alysoides]|uniref:Sugar phosphate permease n=1 Tax=Kineothrix alysoides TaxID=1469948 RepID=A0A4R1QW10_9FIRM|nr:MFS transporter [Kineothrix alysoides]TCL57513.1 sugar phosphate permease [Kineothrix alysoides]
MNQKLFSKDFTLVIAGQIISLFGNAALRFALPLYLLNRTGSCTLYGAVTACAFIPAILLSPAGGIIADRVNKRNVMVILDFLTSALILIFYLCMGGANIILLIGGMLMLLYGIAGFYQPSVQASIPALVNKDKLMAANAVINSVSSLSGLLGPVLGGILYSLYGLKTVLFLCFFCFLLSAIMELFIVIPFEKRRDGENIWKTAGCDFSESLSFIRKEKPIIGKVLLVVCAINLFMSAMIVVGLPYLITEVLNFSPVQANRLYGFAEGALAAGGIAGGVLTGILSKRLAVKKAGNLLLACAVCVFPIGITLAVCSSDMINYIVISSCCFLLMAISTMFTVQMLTFVQAETPPDLVGKVIAVILMISMCAQPIGSAIYGILFENFRGFEYVVVLFAGIIALAIAIGTKKVFKSL